MNLGQAGRQVDRQGSAYEPMLQALTSKTVQRYGNSGRSY